MNQDIQSNDLMAATQAAVRPDGSGEPQQMVSGCLTEQQNHKRCQKLLILLLHADGCQQRESQNNGESSQCTVPGCKTMRGKLNHVMSCQAGENCAVPYCSQSRQILDHWNNCNKKDCPVCQPIKQFRKNGQRSAAAALHTAPKPPLAAPGLRRPFAAYKGFGAGASPGTLTIMTVPCPSLANSQSAPGLMVMFQTDDMKYPQLIGPDAVDWRQYIPANTRDYLVHKVVQALFPTPDPTSMLDRRMDNLVAYARKVESDIYEMASSPFEYYDLLDEKVCKIQKELEEKKQKRNETSKL